MKRLIALLLTLVLVMSLFAACDSKKKDRDDDDDTTEATSGTEVIPTTPVVPTEPTEPTTNAPVVNPPATNSVDGTWVCAIDGAELLGEEAAGITVGVALVIEGTECAMAFDVAGTSESMVGTFDPATMTATFDGEPLTLALNGNTLVATDSDGMALTLTRDNSTPSTPSTPSTGALDGTWKCTMDGSELLGEEAAGITVELTFTASGDTCSLTTTVMGQSDTMNGTVSADKKTVTIDGDDMAVSINGNTLTLTDTTGVAISFTK